VLELLDHYDARATFFMVGAAAQQHPDLVRRVAEMGHAIGNHSWLHPSFDSIGGHRRRKELHACQRALAPYGRPLFRPPYGHQIVASRLDAWLLGYQVVAWNCTVVDWEDNNPDRMAGRLLANIKPGSIVLLHDAIFRAEGEDEVLQY